MMREIIKHNNIKIKLIKKRNGKCDTCLWGVDIFKCDCNYKVCSDYYIINEEILDLQVENFIEIERRDFHEDFWEYLGEYS